MEDSQGLIVHICPRQEWEAAQRAGSYRDQSLKDVGFIHCSRPSQVARVANNYYKGQKDLLLLWIDPQKLKSEVRWEASSGEIFPHIYGPIELRAIVSVQDYLPGPDGIFRRLE